MKTFMCLYCKNEFELKPGSTGKYCSLSHQMAHRGPLLREQRIDKYNQNPSKCNYCNTAILYDKRNQKFCSSSCAASKTNSSRGVRSVETRQKISESLKSLPRSPKKLNHCTVCNNLHPRNTKTCSKDCLTKLRSSNGVLTSKNRIFGGSTTKNKFPFITKDQSVVYLDSTWEQRLAQSLDDNNVQWERPKFFRLSNGRRYTPDFYLPEYNLYLDPKANARQKRYEDAISKIQIFENEFNVRCLIISKKEDLNWNYIKNHLQL